MSGLKRTKTPLSLLSVINSCKCISYEVYSFKIAQTIHRHGSGQLKVMFVWGPNQRKDYHIEEGEEVNFITHASHASSLNFVLSACCFVCLSVCFPVFRATER